MIYPGSYDVLNPFVIVINLLAVSTLHATVRGSGEPSPLHTGRDDTVIELG